MTAQEKVIRIEIRTTETVKEQLNAQGLHIALHTTASLERSRQAILQLGAAGMLMVSERQRIERRFRTAVRDSLRRMIGGRYKVIDND